MHNIVKTRTPFDSTLALALAAIALVIGNSAPAQTPAFPGALGFAANATGGRAGTVYHVTTLANSGPGSFRDAVSQPNRIIVFDVSGYITISSEIGMNDNLTIAGQTAPGGGIGINGNEVSCGASTNIIIRHMRFRPGSAAPQGSAHCLNMFGSTNVIVDHISFEFGPWNDIGGVNIDEVTIQNCIVADPINQQFGAHIEHLNSSCAFLYNIWANGHNRQPLASINTIFINNVTYNYQAGFTTHTSGFFFYDIINNYFITGPATTSPGNDFFQVDSQQSVYASGNLRDSDNNAILFGSPTAPSGMVVLTSAWSPVTATIPTFSPANAYRRNVSIAGAWPRDQVDELVISQVKKLGNGATGTGTNTAGPGGGLYSSQADTGLPNSGFGILSSGVAPLDSDQDGMPDYWELATGSSIVANDAMTIGGDGYAFIEKYLNWLAEPHALVATNQSVDVELWQYTSGFTNVTPTYVVDNATNGTVLLLANGHTARFTPDTNYSGLAQFRFRVSAADGTTYTNNVGLVISSLPQPRDLVWAGDGTANAWDIGFSTNWLYNAAATTFSSGDNVTFDDSGSTTPVIVLTNAVSAGEMVVSSSQDYTFGGSGWLAGPTALLKEGSGKLTFNVLNTFSGGTVINEGVVQLGDGASLNGSLNGGVVNNDTLIFSNPTAVTSAASVSGSGVLIKRSGGTLTLSGTQTYTNLTTIENGTLEFSGTPPLGDITNNTVLTFRPSGATTYAGLISGPGRVQTSGSSITMTLSGANTFTGGINITAGNLQLANNQAAGTGPVTNSSSGLVYLSNGVVVTNDFTLTSSTTDLGMRCDSGTATWAGDVVNLGSGASWRPGSDGGTLVFTGHALQGTRNFIVPRGTFHMASNAVISATGSATALGRDTTDGNRSANIFVRDDAVVTLGACSMGGGRQGGNVTVTLQNNAMLSMPTNLFDLHNVNRATAVTTLRLNGGTLTFSGFSKTRTFTNAINLNGGLIQATTNNATFLPAFVNQSVLVQAGGARIDDGGFVIGIGQPLNHDAALGATLDGGLTKSGLGELVLSGVNTLTGPTRIMDGKLTLSVSGSIGASQNIYVRSGALFDVSATSSGSMTFSSGRMLWGDGACTGNFVMSSGSMLAPGTNAIGKLTFNNSLTLSAGCTNLFEISSSPLTNDTAKVLGNLTNGGALVVIATGPTAPQRGDVFKLFDAASYNGAFSTVLLPSLDTGLAWDTADLNSQGVIRVVATPPVFGGIMPSGTDVILSGSGGIAGGTYYVLTSTNLASPRELWIPVFTNQFGPAGEFSITNVFEPDTPARFYLLQVP